MVAAEDVPRVVADAARLVKSGELVVFGSGALAWWLPDAPESIDAFITPSGRGEVVVDVMGELSWYHEMHGTYVEVWGPETFAAPLDWRQRAQPITRNSAPGVVVVVPHPHDILMAKIERLDPHDRDHVVRIIKAYPLDGGTLDGLADKMPHRSGAITDATRVRAFEENLVTVRGLVADGAV